MANTLGIVKQAAIETYVTLCSSDARAIRAIDERHQNRCRPEDHRGHALAALDWICRAHDMGMDDGVAAMFSLVEGWQGSYAETTGYIIPTMFDAASRFDRAEYRERAIEMAEWLRGCQLESGAFAGSFVGQAVGPRVFNTGQALFGLCRAHAETERDDFLLSAVASGDWLLSQLDDDGAWRRSTLDDIIHAYNARTGWSLLQLAEATGDSKYREAALLSAGWAADQQDDSGWYRHNTFGRTDTSATLHTIAYTMRGLLEIGDATGTMELVDSADRAAGALLRSWQRDHELAGAYSRDWYEDGVWRCVPGECQLVIVWSRLDQIRRNATYRDAAVGLLERVKSSQIMNTTHPDLLGGVSGSVPINGPYERYCLVNWGAKFLIDALLISEGDNGERRPTA
jgi:uncharacterized protein YyaL (SSP411 family)